jgi:hypothetical protein
METSADALEKIEKYESRSAQLIENADQLVRKHELEKAGEFYWGAVGCYLNALQFLFTGKAHSGHGEMVLEAKRIATERGDEPLLEAVKAAEKLHANYYHSFISEDEFPEYYEKALFAVRAFKGILSEKLKSGRFIPL